jgi:hypothetical protein
MGLQIREITLLDIGDILVPILVFSAGVYMSRVYFGTPKIPLLLVVVGLFVASVIYFIKTGKTPYGSAIERLSS